MEERPFRAASHAPVVYFRGGFVFTATAGASDSSVDNVRSLDQQSATIFHSLFGCRCRTYRYFACSSRRLPADPGMRALQRPAS